MSDPQQEPAPPPPRRRSESLIANLRRFSRLWGFLLFLVFVVVLFRAIVLPFIFATLLAYLLAPAVRRMEPRTGRVGAVILIYLAILAVLAAFFGLLMPAVVHDLAKLRNSAPTAIENFQEVWIPRISSWLEATFGGLLSHEGEAPMSRRAELLLFASEDGTWRADLSSIRFTMTENADGSWLVHTPDGTSEDITETIRRLLANKGAELSGLIGPWLQAFLVGVAAFLTKFIITFMLAAFILIDIERVNNALRNLIPHEYRRDFDELMRGMDKGLAGVIRGQLLICLVNGVLTFIGLIIFDVKYSFLLALVAGVFSLIPIFGTIVSSVPIVLLAAISSDDGLALGPAGGILVWILGIHLIEGNFLNPKIIGDSAAIHPVIVVFALLAGEHVYGLVGALLAVPTASMVQTAFLYARRQSGAFNRESEVVS